MLRRVLAIVAVSVAFATSLSVCATVSAAPDIDAQLQEADRLAWLTDWSSALPVYKAAEADEPPSWLLGRCCRCSPPS